MIDNTSDTTANHTVEGDSGLFACCPDCNGRDFLVKDLGPVLFACLTCDSRWRYLLGYTWRITPRAQPGNAGVIS